MGKVSFELRIDKPNKYNFCPMRLVYHLNSRRVYYSIKDSIHPLNWDDKNQKGVYVDKKTFKTICPDADYEIFPTNKEIEFLNNNLNVLRKEIIDIEHRYKLNKIVYSAEMIVNSLKETRTITTKKEVPSNHLFDFIDKYINDNQVSREPGSLSVYKSLKNHLQNFQNTKGIKVKFENIDYSFFQDFQNYLINMRSKKLPNGMGNVTIAKQLSTLKTFLNYARMHGIEVQNKYKDFKIKKENLEVIALTNSEFETLFDMDLSKNKKLSQVRDAFCFSCVTGLRYSDLAQLKRENIKKDEIRITIKKTKELLTIPMNKYSESILKKYTTKLRPIPIISNQKMNDYIKELCEKAEISEPVQIVRYRGARREEVLHPKHELISVHTGRKTFCTLSLEKGMSAEEVMKISGHKDYKSFSRYVKITDQRTKLVMNKAWG